MKKSQVPQDKSALENFTREVCYVKNDEGKYETDLSQGWETKKIALDKAWEHIEERVNEATTETLPELKADHEAKTACMLALRAEHAELKSAEDKADQVEDEAHERLETLEDEYEAHKKRRKTASF